MSTEGEEAAGLPKSCPTNGNSQCVLSCWWVKGVSTDWKALCPPLHQAEQMGTIKVQRGLQVPLHSRGAERPGQEAGACCGSPCRPRHGS